MSYRNAIEEEIKRWAEKTRSSPTKEQLELLEARLENFHEELVTAHGAFEDLVVALERAIDTLYAMGEKPKHDLELLVQSARFALTGVHRVSK